MEKSNKKEAVKSSPQSSVTKKKSAHVVHIRSETLNSSASYSA